jgi:hypothetical protein
MLISPERTKKLINNRAFFNQNGKSKEEALELVEANKKEEVGLVVFMGCKLI